MQVDVREDIDWGLIRKRLNDAFEVTQKALDNQILKDSNYHAPQDKANLIESGVRNTDPGSGKIIWDTEYAKRLYYNPQYNFSKDKNPNAGGLWFERAKSVQFRHWLTLAQHTFGNKFNS